MGERTCLDAARASGLVRADEPLLVLLSGGADSTCLLDVALRLKARVSALHVNYGLREEADADESHCRSLCSALGVALSVECISLPDSGNLQANARAARYALAERVAAGDYTVAHTASDQAETIVYRLATSPGRRSLLGMAARRGRLVRPLLAVGREQTREHCRAHGLSWREDASNKDDRFARVRVRRDVMPGLRSLGSAVDATLAETARSLRDEQVVLDYAVDDALIALGGGPAVGLDALARLPTALARLVLRRLAVAAVGHDRSLSRAEADAVLGLAREGSRSLDLGAGLRAVAEYGTLRLADRAEGEPRVPEPVPLAAPGSVRFGNWVVEAEHGRGGEVAVSAATVASGLVVRCWRSGDRIRPVGLGGSKTLQDLLTDRKIPRALRRSLPVVETVSGEIVWVAGVALDERFAAAPDDVHPLSLSARTAHGLTSRAVADPEIGEILVHPDELADRVAALGAEISHEYAGRSILLVGVLKGAIFFLSDLMRALEVECDVDFMAVASYGSSTSSSGVVRILKDLDASIEGRDVLIVEDIVDSGLTLSYLLRTLRAREPASLEVCALLTKPERRKVELPIRYTGFEIPNRFVVGYGLDHAERFRNLPYVAVLDGDAA